MTLKFFLETKDFQCLKQAVPSGALCLSALEQAVHFADPVGPRGAGNSVVTCDDVAARDLLMHARTSCPKAATRIAEAFRAAGLTP